MKIAGLDIGTTGCKLTVFDADGRMLDRAYRDYPVRRSVGGHEIDASAVMDGVYGVMAELSARHSDVGAIGVTSFGETCVLTDGDGRPLHDAMLYTDPRGAEEVRTLCKKLGERHIASITGLRPHEMYSIGKLMWLKNRAPELYRQAKHAFLMEDFVVFHLTGQAQIDYSLACRTMAFDIRALAWSEELFSAAGIDPALMSRPVPTGTVAGTLTPSAAERTGLAPSCRIVSVSHDQIASAVGAGAFDPSVAVDGAGTVECLTPLYDAIPDMDVMSRGHFSVVPYVIPGTYVAYAFSYTGGALIQWCVDTLAKAEKERAAQQGLSVNEYLEQMYAASHGDAPSGLLVLPHFAGAATPYMDTGSRGAILGLTTATDVPALYRACMEGVAYEMRVNYEALRDSGVHFERLHATGGGARSKVWMQMKADVLNLPITALRTVDAGTVGSAMLTGVAVDLFPDLQAAAACMVQPAETYFPDAARHAAYREQFEKYKGVYAAVRPLV